MTARGVLSADAAARARGLFLSASLVLWSTVDLPSAWSIASISLTGVRTLAICLLMALALCLDVRSLDLRTVRLLAPLTALILLGGAASLAIGVPVTRVAQNVAVYLAAVLCCTAAASVAGRGPDLPVLLRRALLVFAVAPALLFLVSRLSEDSSNGPRVGAREYALSAVVALVVVTSWRGSRAATLTISGVVLAAVLVSVSRTALLACCVVLVLPAYRFTRRRLLSLGVAAAAIAVVVVAAASRVPLLHERMFEGDRGARVAGVYINTSGRTSIWKVVWAQVESSPWFGHGLGSSSESVHRVYANIDQPHNDYLRLLADVGLLGCLALVCAVAPVLFALVRRYPTQHCHRDVCAGGDTTRMGRLLAPALAIIMLTDNPIVYDFVLGPAALVAGLALGHLSWHSTTSAVQPVTASDPAPAPRARTSSTSTSTV